MDRENVLLKSSICLILVCSIGILIGQENPEMAHGFFGNKNHYESKSKFDSTFRNFYIINQIDTIYYTKNAKIYDCNYLKSMASGDQNCQILSFGKPVNGEYYNSQILNDSSIHVFNGRLRNGFIVEGSIIEYYYSGRIKMTGQYSHNWRIGFWTYFFENGKVEEITKYILEAGEPVMEWLYDKSGTLIYFNDEQIEIERIINENQN